MNRLTIIGNLTGKPVLRTTSGNKNVANFTVAVNRFGVEKAEFFRVAAWDKIGENCAKFLDKGSKVAVVGTVQLEEYVTQSGENRASMTVHASEVEFLSTKEKNGFKVDSEGFIDVTDDDELPWTK